MNGVVRQVSYPSSYLLGRARGVRYACVLELLSDPVEAKKPRTVSPKTSKTCRATTSATATAKSRCSSNTDYRCYPQDFIGNKGNLFKAHVAKSMYAIQLERWFTLFGRENVKVWLTEWMRDDLPRSVLHVGSVCSPTCCHLLAVLDRKLVGPLP